MWSFPNHYFLQFCLETIPHDTCHIKLQSGAKKLQSGAAFSNYKVGQNSYKVGQLKNSNVGQKNYKVGRYYKVEQKKSQSGTGITKWGITVLNIL